MTSDGQSVPRATSGSPNARRTSAPRSWPPQRRPVSTGRRPPPPACRAVTGVALLDRRVEGVHVDVEDLPHERLGRGQPRGTVPVVRYCALVLGAAVPLGDRYVHFAPDHMVPHLSSRDCQSRRGSARPISGDLFPLHARAREHDALGEPVAFDTPSPAHPSRSRPGFLFRPPARSSPRRSRRHRWPIISPRLSGVLLRGEYPQEVAVRHADHQFRPDEPDAAGRTLDVDRRRQVEPRRAAWSPARAGQRPSSRRLIFRYMGFIGIIRLIARGAVP